MDYINLRKRTVIRKYHDSDIFNLKNEMSFNKSSNPSKNRTTQGSLEKTKDDIFNTLNNDKERRVKPLKKKVYIQNYLNHDLFNTHLNDTPKNKKQNKRINVNASSCFNGIINNEEYKKELSNYSKIHRSEKKDYNPDIYFNKISAVGRYYNELYGDEKSGVFPSNNNLLSKTFTNSPNKKGIKTVFANNLRDFEARKRKLKIELNKNKSECNFNGKRKFNKKKIDIYGRNLDDKNNKSLIKEKNEIKNNTKLYKQLEYQSNIFGEQNKDINTKINDYINNKNKEKERKLKLKEKNKKENEEINNKINEHNKKNLCLNKNIWGASHCKWQKSNMDWKDPGAQFLFKRIYTEGNLNRNNTEISAFQRKLYDMGDSDNIDTLSEIKKDLNIEKYKIKKVINEDDNNTEETKEILRTLPNNVLRTDQKIRIINGSTTSNFLNNSSNENLNKMINRINNNIKNTRISKGKKKSSYFIKIMGKNSLTNNKSNTNIQNNKNIIDNYLLVYSTKSSNKFDNLNPIEIKKMFREKGIHIFDVKKDELGIGKLNKIKFKVRENEEDKKDDLEQKIKMVENDLNKNKYKVSIKKDENIKKTKIKKNNENSIKETKNKTTLNGNRKKNLISQFPIADFKYKNFNTKK